MFLGKDIYNLIPQRPPIVMIDGFEGISPTEALSTLTVLGENIFVQDNKLQEPGIIEHIAQSAAALSGYEDFLLNQPPKIGYIGEIKKCNIDRLPLVGEQLSTNLQIVAEAMGIKLLQAEVRIGDTIIADCSMKIFLRQE